MKTKIYKNCNTLNILESINDIYNESDELAKSFAISLLIPQGSFVLDQTIGSDFIKKVKQLTSKNLKSKLLYLLKEVSLTFQLINIENVEYSLNKKSSSLSLLITIKITDNIYLISLEVDI